MLGKIKSKIQKFLGRGFSQAYPNSLVGNSASLSEVQFEGANFVAQECSLSQVKLGSHTYCGKNVSLTKTRVGRFCSIGPNTQVGLGIHPTDKVSTHPAFYSNNKMFQTFADKVYIDEYQEVEIGHDVWLAGNVMVMGGLSIGTGAIVAAGSVVTKDLEPYGIYGGIPAKLLKYRFEADTRLALMESRWWDRPVEDIRKNWRSFLNVKDFLTKGGDEL